MKSYKAIAVVLSGWAIVAGAYPLVASENFGSVTIPQSATATVTVVVTTAGTLGSVSVLTQGAPNLDFTDAGGGTCTAGTAYAVNATCTVEVAFKPRFAGSRYGAVLLTDSSSSQDVMATAYLQGTGDAPQLAFLPELGPLVLSKDCQSAANPGAIAIDGRGTVFVIGAGFILDYPQFNVLGCNSPATFMSNIAGGGIAVDGSGNLYLSTLTQSGHGRLFKETLLPNGNYFQAAIGSGLDDLWGVAVDGGGNVYASNDASFTGSVPAVFKESLQPDGSYIQTTIGTGWSFPSGLAIDGNGDVYVGDLGTGVVYKETPSAGTYTQTIVASGLNNLFAVAVDGVGNVYAVCGDPNLNQIQGSGIHVESPQPNGSYVETLVPIQYANTSQTSMEVDGAGNYYVTDEYGNAVYEEDLADPPAIAFPSTKEGQPGGTEQIELGNIGTEPLTVSSIVYPADFPAGAPVSPACALGKMLAPGANCVVSVAFKPVTPVVPPATSLTLNEKVEITTNSLNVVKQLNVPVSGTELYAFTATPKILPPPGPYYAEPTITITDATPGAKIYYTLNGTAPTAASTRYSAPFTLKGTATVNALAIAVGDQPSAVASAAFHLVAGAPVLTPPGGTFKGTQEISITSPTPTAAIFYTTNGGTPTPSSTRYATPILVNSSETIRAVAIEGGFTSSQIVAQSYVIVSASAAAPVIAPAAGTYPALQSISISDTTPGAVLYYTVDGTTPTASSTKYTGPFTSQASETIEAIATATGYAPSAVVTASYTSIGSPSALAAPATALGTTNATLNAVAYTQGLAGSYYFQYGTSSAALTSSTAKVTLSATATGQAAAAALTTLKSKTTYYFQVVVSTAAGTGSGEILSFTTN